MTIVRKKKNQRIFILKITIVRKKIKEFSFKNDHFKTKKIKDFSFLNDHCKEKEVPQGALCGFGHHQ